MSLEAYSSNSREASDSQVPVIVAMLALLSAGGFAVAKDIESPLATVAAWGGLLAALFLGAVYALLRVPKGR